MASPSNKVLAGAAAGVIAVGAGAAKLATRGGDDVVRSSDDAGRLIDGVGSGVGVPAGAAGAGAREGVTANQSQTQALIHQVLCEEFKAMVGPESPGVITRDELLGSVTSIVGERITGVDPFFVQGLADDLLVAEGLAGEFGGSAPYTYLRACPP